VLISRKVIGDQTSLLPACKDTVIKPLENVDIFYEAGGCTGIAIYNNIFKGLYHGVLASRQQGCLIAYNFSTDEHSTSGVQFQTASNNASHAAEGMMTLWEGNYGNAICTDRIHGAAAYQTVWRSMHHGVDTFVDPTIPNLATARQAMVFLCNGSYWWHVVGCVLGDTWAAVHDSNHVYSWTQPGFDNCSSTNYGGIFMLGYDGFGNALDANVATRATLYTNYSFYQGAIQDTGASSVDTSLAWPSKPSWFGTLAWPAYDPSSPLSAGNTAASRNPAGYRYINGIDPPASGGAASIISGKASFSGKITIH
jgi:hypothetical protein